MHVITFTPGTRVNLAAVSYRLTASWSTEERALSGLAADVIAVTAEAPTINPDGSASWPIPVVTVDETAGATARRAKVIPGLIQSCRQAIDDMMASTPAEPLVIAVVMPAAPKPVRVATTVCSPSSNNDEIARSMVAVARAKAPVDGVSTEVAVGAVYTQYCVTQALSAKRQAGIATKLAELSFTV